MCGVAGGWTLGQFTALEAAVPHMIDALAHRGPDGAGVWRDSGAGVVIGHRRLSVVDLSEAGSQPMASASGRWIIAFNGEVYNHSSLRADLEASGRAPTWRGHSDTESILAAVEAWGVEGTLQRCVGMFAIVLWDRNEEVLWLLRDRFGEKPLYYGWNRGTFMFASELKALTAFPGFDAQIDRRALAQYLRHNAVPAPLSIYEGIRKVPCGSIVRVTRDNIRRGDLPDPAPYWSAASASAAGKSSSFNGSEGAAAHALEAMLRDSIAGQMIADVPLGAFLSGGVDSSLVVAIMQSLSSRPIRTFSIGFNEDKYNEAHHAAAVASHLGTDHTDLYVSAGDALNVIPQLAEIYSEPFADSSQIPTVLLARLAREHVTVALSGDGGDEMFGGYSRYEFASRFWRALSHIPRPLRRVAARGISSGAEFGYSLVGGKAASARQSRFLRFADKVGKGAALVSQPSREEFYRELVALWSPAPVYSGRVAPHMSFGHVGTEFLSFPEYMMLQDAAHYLPDDILVKVDRAAMSCGLEARIPMLDHRIYEFAWRLPLEFKMDNGIGKRVLRRILFQYVPERLVDRPKKGFAVPIDEWLRGPLREWASTLLDPLRLREDGYLDPLPIERKWKEHLAGARNWQHHIWCILMFQAWVSAQKAQRS